MIQKIMNSMGKIKTKVKEYIFQGKKVNKTCILGIQG